ncbi:hypothetical protein [Lysinibacillus sphaericus]|uniref:hypothetical protein n=1 Tax=Lysinibacillus sphaericus TaxID=1421 RepID=UPI0005675A56|nr:hypothetical protein [Lysinibacillus sphaericus]
MTTQRTKLVHCHTITYVYNYISPKNSTAFSFETEDVQLQRFILSNFIDDYAVLGFTLAINAEDVPFLQTRLDNFLLNIAKRGLKYIAVLDLAKEHPCVHLITNKSTKLTDQQLTNLWDNTVTIDYISYDELLTRYATVAQKTSMLTTQYIFTSGKLKKPRILHNDSADHFLYSSEIIDADECEVYEFSMNSLA